MKNWTGVAGMLCRKARELSSLRDSREKMLKSVGKHFKAKNMLCWGITICLLASILVIAPAPASAATVVSYPLPACYTASSLYTVQADSTNIPVIDSLETFKNYNYCNFSFSGTTTITITASENITSFSISPLAYDIAGSVSGNKLTFTLSQSRYLIVKINGLKDLVIAADDLESSVPPSSGTGVYNITESPYNADSTGTSLSTKAIQTAIDDANAAGGGTVYVPSGVFTCGNLVLKSNVSVYLEGGAVIRGTGNPSDYTRFYTKNSLAMDGTWFIYTQPDSSNIKIFGRGTIDGNGHYMRNTYNYLNNLVVPLQCSYFTIEGVTLRDSGLWALIPTRSDHVTIQNTKHFNNNELDYENDAIDIQECQSVNVTHTIAISEDDTYSTKTWETTTDIAESWPGSPETQTDITFDDCVAWSRCAGFKVGFGVFQQQSDITVKNSSVYRCMRALAVNQKYGSSSAIAAQNITFENIDIEGYWPRTGNSEKWLEATIDANNGTVKNLIFKNINVRAVGKDKSALRGNNPSVLLDGVAFSDIKVGGAKAYTLAAMNITDTNNYVANVTIKQPEIVSIQPVSVTAAIGSPPVMPSVVTSVYEDGGSSQQTVIWNGISPAQYAQEGSFTVNGIVAGTTIPAVANITVRQQSIATVQPVNLTTKAGTRPTLPEAVDTVTDDGTTSKYLVTWSSISPSQYARVGSFTVSGDIIGTGRTVTAQVTVDYKDPLEFMYATSELYDQAVAGKGTILTSLFAPANPYGTIGVDAPAVSGKMHYFAFPSTGGWGEYYIDVPAAGTYNVKIGIKKMRNKGKFQLSIDGTDVGGVVDEFAPGSTVIFEPADLGNVTFTSPGIKRVRLTSAGKNSGSSNYTIVSDYIKLTPSPVIALDRSSAMMAEGETLSLNATVNIVAEPYKMVDWSVISESTPGIVTVNESGVVTALKSGTATVRVSSAVYAAAYADCNFTVVSPFTIGTPVFKDALGNTLTHLIASADLRASVTITSNMGTPEDACFIVALYDSGNTLKNISYLDSTVSAHGTLTFNAGFALPSDVTGYYVKVFVWDSMDGMLPLTNATTFQ